VVPFPLQLTVCTKIISPSSFCSPLRLCLREKEHSLPQPNKCLFPPPNKFSIRSTSSQHITTSTQLFLPKISIYSTISWFGPGLRERQMAHLFAPLFFPKWSFFRPPPPIVTFGHGFDPKSICVVLLPNTTFSPHTALNWIFCPLFRRFSSTLKTLFFFPLPRILWVFPNHHSSCDRQPRIGCPSQFDEYPSCLHFLTSPMFLFLKREQVSLVPLALVWVDNHLALVRLPALPTESPPHFHPRPRVEQSTTQFEQFLCPPIFLVSP